MTDRDPLFLDAETMRRLGYLAVDAAVDRITNLRSEPVWRAGDRTALEAALREPPPAGPQPFEDILEQLRRAALPFGARVDHPRFFAFVPGSNTWPGVLADFLAAAWNVFQGSWMGGAGASQIELVVLDWFRQWIGYPATAAGLFTSGGSAANLIAIACARQIRFGGHDDGAVLYLSDEAHSSLDRAARILGFREARVRKLRTGDDFRMDPRALDAAVRADRAAGLTPFLVIANGGATSTGAVDSLDELAVAAREHGLWLHVDAAYGGFAVLTDVGRATLRGIDQADSVTLDPHKWLFQPFEAGSLLVRDGRQLEQAFRVLPDYLQDAAVEKQSELPPVNFMDRGIQLTRAAKALKVWFSIKYFGLPAFQDAIGNAIELTLRAETELVRAGFEILSPATLGIVCFRRVLDGGGRTVTDEARLEALNTELVNALAASGVGLISSTRVRGRYALRFCILNHATRWEDVAQVIEWLRTARPNGAPARPRDLPTGAEASRSG